MATASCPDMAILTSNGYTVVSPNNGLSLETNGLKNSGNVNIYATCSGEGSSCLVASLPQNAAWNGPQVANNFTLSTTSQLWFQLQDSSCRDNAGTLFVKVTPTQS
jgi:hypothetical protein